MKLSQKRKLIRIGAGAVAGLLAFLMLFGLVADLFFRTNAAAASQAEISALKEKLKKRKSQKNREIALRLCLLAMLGLYS